MTQTISRRNLAHLLGGAAAAAFLPLSANAAWTPADRKKVNMIIRSQRPLDCEMPLDGFLTEFTPVERFFTRSHHYEPKVDFSSWRLELAGTVSKPQKLTFEAIQKLPKVDMPAVLECAGNGRGFYEPSMPGIQWEHGAVANAKWSGVRLADVLKLAGVDEKATEIIFDGADVPVGTMPEFQRSIPLSKAMDPDTILAYEMNGEPLPSLHGFPLRVIAPGWAGDCWVKWLTRIEASNKPFEGFFMKTAYRHPGKAVKPGVAVDPALMSPVAQLVPKSVIASPGDGTEVEVGKSLQLKGVAWCGGNNRVSAVEVSTNGGLSWTPARPGSFGGPYAWRSWQYSFLPTEEGYLRIMVRATDSAGATQPFVESWNPSGYLWNVVHSIGVNVVKELKPAAAPPQMSSAKAESPALYKTNCIGCHEDDVITQQRLTRGQWEKEVEKMGRWGSSFKPTDKDAIVDYLAKEFPYKKR